MLGLSDMIYIIVVGLQVQQLLWDRCEMEILPVLPMKQQASNEYHLVSPIFIVTLISSMDKDLIKSNLINWYYNLWMQVSKLFSGLT